MAYPLSATKLVTYNQCPQAYSFRYERGISLPGAFGSPDLGNALHQALAIAYRDSVDRKHHKLADKQISRLGGKSLSTP